MTNPAINPMWHLSPVLSVREAAALVAGYEPRHAIRLHDENGSWEEQVPDYPPVLRGLQHAVRSKKLEADVRYHDNSNGPGDINWDETTLDVDVFKKWLDESRNIRPPFFFKQSSTEAPYLDPAHPRFAPKLAAAVSAWLVVEQAPEGKTVKQALQAWLRENASRFRQSDDDGKPNETFVEEASKVANWAPGGGAPKTPG